MREFNLTGIQSHNEQVKEAVEDYYRGKNALEYSGLAILALTVIAGFGAVFALHHFGFSTDACFGALLGTPVAAGILSAIPFGIDIPRRKAVNTKISVITNQQLRVVSDQPWQGSFKII